MRKNFILLCLLALLSIAISWSCGEKSNQPQIVQQDSSKANQYGGYESQAKWGEHLVSIGGCSDCHTPKKMTNQGPVDDSSLYLSGHPAGLALFDIDRKDIEKKGLAVTGDLTAWAGPWGVSFAANLTPDSTGLGAWKEEQFLYAIKNGKFKGLPDSRPLLPPMPWPSISTMTDDELKATFAYLKTIKPVNNIVPSAMPPMSARPAK